MYNSQYYTCEQIDQRLLQGYLDDYNTENGTSLTKAQFLQKLALSFTTGALISSDEMDEVLEGEVAVYLTDADNNAVLDETGKPIEII